MYNLKRIKLYFKKDKAILLKIVLTTISRGLAAIGTFLFDFILAKSLGVDEFGDFMLVYSILVGTSFIVRFGLPQAILRFSGIYFENNNYNKILDLRKISFLLSFILSVIVSFFLLIFNSYISDLLFDGRNIINLIVLLCIALPFHSTIIIQSSFIKSFKKSEFAPLFEIGLIAFISAILLFILKSIKYDLSIELSFLIYILASLVVIVCGYFFISRALSRIKDDYVLNHIRQNRDFLLTLPDYALSSIIGYLLRFSPLLILGYYNSSYEVGLFSIANRVSFLISFILWVFHTVYGPIFANLYHSGRLYELESVVRRSILYMSVISLPIVLLIFSFPSKILFFFGEEYSKAKTALIILAFSQLINVLTGPVYFLLNMTKYQNKMRNIMILTMITNIMLSIYLIPRYGYIGAALSAGFGLIFQNVLAFRFCNKYLNIKIYRFGKQL